MGNVRAGIFEKAGKSGKLHNRSVTFNTVKQIMSNTVDDRRY
jgi:hypothetical protein